MMWPFSRVVCGVLPLGLLLIAVVLDGPDGLVAQETDELGFEVRTYNGTNNNLDYPLWGSVNITQIRAVASANYSDGVSAVSGSDRPTAREVTTEVFLAASSVRSSQSALFVGWALLVSYDLFLNADDETLSFDIPCDDGHETVDVWCPEGAGSEDIEFFRSQAEVSGVRNPLNLATSYLDLDFMYGRSEAEAEALRTMEGGYMNLTDDDMPVQYDNGTWLLGDQRTAVFPVTFALHIMLLREHNICCETIAPDLGYEGDEDIYQVCRAWTIAVFEQITNSEFNVRLTGTDILSEYTPVDDIVSSSYATASSSSESTDNTTSNSNDAISSNSSSTMTPTTSDQRDLRRLYDLYSGEINPGADVLATTVGVTALYAAIPPTVRIMEEGYDPADEDGLELTEAAEDIAGLFERNSVGSIIRGAVFSSSLAVDAHFSSAVSTTSPLFKLPVDAIQRGRDHGVPTYNDARDAYGLSRATSFADVTDDTNVQTMLEDAYGGDIGLLDALTGALAEGSNMSSDAVLGDLLQEVWKDQLYRTLVGDRLYQSDDVITTDAENQTLLDLIERTTNVTDLPLSVFTVPEITVCYDNCSAIVWSSVYLSDEFKLAWDIQDNYEYIAYTLSAKYIGGEGYMGIGFGGDEMVDADDFIICEVLSSTSAECTDRQSVSSHTKPEEDTENSSLFVEEVTVDGDWTSVTFYRHSSDLDDEDYNLYEDLDGETATLVIFAYRAGEGIQRHATSNRGTSSVNFVTGSYSTVCDEDADFYLLHGALILSAWLALLPVGIFFARYRKGEKEFFGSQWWEMHAELMIIASEIVLPMSITAIVATSGSHDSYHARWGFYMITAITLQILTGFLRQRALEGKHSNFSLLHRVNKHVHIWFGHFAFLAGAIQCYRGVELVSATDSLHFSAIEDLVEFEIGNFGFVYDYVMPSWLGVIGVLFLFFETRKQLARYKKKGAAMVCCVYELTNKKFVAEGREVYCDNAEAEHHPLMPRTRALPLLTMDEFNLKVLNGMSWVIVDGAILDVGNFSRRHPGGARVIVNGLGTDITSKMEGEDPSVGSKMSFTPHDHSETAWELARSLVVGYIDDEDSDNESGGDESAGENFDHRPRATSIEQSQLASRHRSVAAHDQRTYIGLGSSVSGGGRKGQYARNPTKPSNRESTMRAAMIARAWGEKARRKGSVNAVPLTPTQTSLVPVAAEAFLENIERNKDRRHFVLQRFHVCPLVLRHKLDGGKDEDRAVYRYVFKCPGEAAILAQTATGVCYFNMRVVRSNGDSMVQRSYNATAVRVIRPVTSGDASSAEPVPTTDHYGNAAVQPKTGDTATPEDGATAADAAATGRPSDTSANAPGSQDDTITNAAGSSGRHNDHIGFVGRNTADNTKDGEERVLPAVESREGLLCVEMRIRLYKDGAMSNLLKQLPNDSTNATVQLQGPFPVDGVILPPAHRNVIMIAAGTGINPMVQLIRDYQSFDSQDTLRTTGRSRLALLWQATTASDLYCLEELSCLKARGRDLLEITTLVSGNHRKTNKPKAPTAPQGRRKRRAVAAAAKAAAAARGVGHDPVNNSSRPSSSGFFSRIFSGSPIPSRPQSIDGSAADNELPTSAPTSSGARDTGISYSKVTGAAPAASGGHAYGGIENEGLDNLFVGSRLEDVEEDSKTPRGSPLSGPHGARTSASPLGIRNEECVVGQKGQGERHQGSSARISRERSPAPLRETKGAAPDEPTLEESLTSSSSNFAPAPGTTGRPKELPQPSREHIRGKYFSPPRMGIISSPRTGKVSEEILREVFGEGLTQAINGFNARYSTTLGASQQAVEHSGREVALAALCGTKTESGKLQVVLSGPSGFVFQVEHMLEEMGVPEEALLILD